MKLVTHLDPTILETELLERVDRAHPKQAFGATLVIVPTARLARHVRRRLTEMRGAWLGVEVLDFRSLAFRILESGSGRVPQVASPRLLEALLKQVASGTSRNAWTAFVRRRPGTLGRLRGALNDLREAGIDADTLAENASARRDVDLADLYRLYTAALDRCAKAGWVDDAGLISAALPLAGRLAGKFGSVFLHGAYELIGVRVDLIHEMDRAVPLTVLLPGDADSPVARYSRDFVETLSRRGLAFDVEPAGNPEPGVRPALEALYDERSTPAPAPDEYLSFRHAQGPAAEFKAAMYDALESIRSGCPPAEIAIVARNLEPYVAAMEDAAEELPGSPSTSFTSSARAPLRRLPLVRDFLLLLRVIDEDFPRAPTVELLRSPRLNRKAVFDDGRDAQGDRADVWSRSAGVIGGFTEWRDVLPGWAEQIGQRQAALQITACLEAIQRTASWESKSWSDHAAHLESLLRIAFRDAPEADTDDTLRQVFDEMRRMESLVGDRRPRTYSEMRGWLEDAVDGEDQGLFERDRGGIRVLDAMQARGLTFREIHLLGLNSGQFPKAAREDPVLGESLRQRLREATGRPLGVKSRRRHEERLLLSIVVGAAGERVAVSWQRADEAGRAKTPSLALRELARLACGAPDLRATVEAGRHLRSHPAQWLEDLVQNPGLLPPAGERVLAALNSRGSKGLQALAEQYPELSGGVDFIAATQGFRPVDPSYDARIGPLDADAPFSVSGLESLGRCPLQFFFKHVLRVGELDEQADAFDVSRRDWGTHVHAILEAVYRDLESEGLFAGAPFEQLLSRGLKLLDREWSEVIGGGTARIAERLPVLWDWLAGTWLDALRAFLKKDLRHAHDNSLRPVGLEETLDREVDFGEGTIARIRGRFDRRLAGADVTAIGDYKTSGALERRVKPTNILKGQALQVPLYWMLAGGEASVELLGLGPEFDPRAGEHRYDFAGLEGELRDSFLATVRTLIDLRNRGTFPLNKQDNICGWCTYRQACRRNHPPTVEREKLYEETLAYQALQKKSTRKPHG